MFVTIVFVAVVVVADKTMHQPMAVFVAVFVVVIVAVFVAVIDIEGWIVAVFQIEWCSVAVIVASLLPQ